MVHLLSREWSARWWGATLLLFTVVVTGAHAAPPPAGVTIERGLVYAKGAGFELTLDLFSPEGITGPFGTIVILQGERSDPTGRAGLELLAENLAARAHVAAIVQYRTLREARYPAALQDVRAAIEWLRGAGAARQISSDHLVLLGENFGGYLAALVALTPHSKASGVQGVVAIHAPSDLPSYRPYDSYPYAYALFLGSPAPQRPDLWRDASPLNHIRSDTPPFLLLHGSADDYVPLRQSEVMAAALKKAGGDVELVTFAGAANGLLAQPESQRRVQQRVNRFVDRTIRPLPPGVSVIKDIAYASPAGRDLRLDLYATRAAADRRRPGVILLHGGGWLWGARQDVGPLAAKLASRGFVAATVEYRLAQERIYPAAVDDVKAAVRWMRANAPRYGIDPDAIGVSGISAGGHLAALLGVTNDRRFFRDADRYRDVSAAVQAVAPIAGVVDMPAQDARDRYSPAIFLGSTPNERPEVWREASPIHLVNSSAAPFLFLHGTKDELVAPEEARAMAQRLRAAGVAAEVYEAEGGDHDFIHVSPWRDAAIERLIGFLSRTLCKPQ